MRNNFKSETNNSRGKCKLIKTSSKKLRHSPKINWVIDSNKTKKISDECTNISKAIYYEEIYEIRRTIEVLSYDKVELIEKYSDYIYD